MAHVQFGHPTTESLRKLALQAATSTGAKVHDGGALVVIDGPAFSTRAESELYRSWGARIVGMTALPEAKLAREAELAYSLLAMSTDYDCWHEEEVSVDAVVAVMQANVDIARRTIAALAETLPEKTEALPYPRACENAVMTAPQAMTPEVRQRLDLIIGHYL